MASLFLLSLYLVSSFFTGGAPSGIAGEESPVSFVPCHIYLDSGEHPLAAYQFELKIKRGDVKIVGVEGGEHPAFGDAPYYDPAALSRNRIIIAAFNTAESLPTGRTRIATLHLQVTGEVVPDYESVLTVSADAEGKSIPTTITFEQGESK
jgi:hypothetical protein